VVETGGPTAGSIDEVGRIIVGFRRPTSGGILTGFGSAVLLASFPAGLAAGLGLTGGGR